MQFGTSAGFGVKGKPDLWISQDPENVRPLHFALGARDRRTVHAFHAAAVSAGAADNGRPGIRKDYHPTYYAAFVLDPRYWRRGPQHTLFVPGPVLRPDRNELVVLELDVLADPTARFVARPSLGPLED